MLEVLERPELKASVSDPCALLCPWGDKTISRTISAQLPNNIYRRTDSFPHHGQAGWWVSALSGLWGHTWSVLGCKIGVLIVPTHQNHVLQQLGQQKQPKPGQEGVHLGSGLSLVTWPCRDPWVECGLGVAFPLCRGPLSSPFPSLFPEEFGDCLSLAVGQAKGEGLSVSSRNINSLHINLNKMIHIAVQSYKTQLF